MITYLIRNIEENGMLDSDVRKWVEAQTTDVKKVGIMLEATMGRPGGDCMQEHNNALHFQPCATTPNCAEYVLTYFGDIGKNQTKIENLFIQKSSNHRLKLACKNKNDFLINVENEVFNIKENQKIDPYTKEYGLDIDDTHGNPLYLSFVSGPNASVETINPYCWCPRKNKTDEIDILYRTRSKAAVQKYETFEKMVISAVMSSLLSMEKHGVKWAVIAPLSCGVCGGTHARKLKDKYFQICNQVVDHLAKNKLITFERIKIPIFLPDLSEKLAV